MAEIRYVREATWEIYSCRVSNLGLGDSGYYPATPSKPIIHWAHMLTGDPVSLYFIRIKHIIQIKH